jgi:RsiW-degrading membrane proteinase PrsW (M82 family)
MSDVAGLVGAMPILSLMILCAAALVVWIYHEDRFEKEPLWAVGLALLTGFGMMWLLGLADDFAISFLHLTRDRIVTKAAVIALIEEGGKLIAVLLLAYVILRKQFNDPMDGLIYGRLAGLGMAVEESLLYLSLAPATLQTLGIEIVRLFAHSLMGGIVGFAIGLGASPGRRRDYHPRLVLLCLALSTTMHFAWNVAAYSRSSDLWSRLLPMGIMLLMMVMWRWFCTIAQQRAKELFT